MRLKLVDKYPAEDVEPNTEQQTVFSNQPSEEFFTRMFESMTSEIKQLGAKVETLSKEVESLKREQEDEVLTQAQLNARYFHLKAETMGDLVNVPGFPKLCPPKKANPRYSLKAVQKWVQEQK